MASRYTRGLEGGIERGYRTACGNCENRKQIFEEMVQQSEVLFDGEFICCGKVACRIDIPLQYSTANVSTKAFDTVKEADELGDSAEAFDKHLGINKDSIDLANDFAKHFDSHFAAGVKATLVHTRIGEWTSQGNNMFHSSSIIPASPWLAAIVFFIVLFYLVY